MKFTLLIILFTTVQLFASVYSQTTRLSINMKNVTLVDVFEQIEERSEFRFLYNNEMIKNERFPDVNYIGKTINEILDQVLKGTGNSYSILENNLVVITQTNMQQKSDVKGKVTNISGEPIPGVTVLIKGAATGAVTDINGYYELRSIQPNAVIQFSFIGMKSEEMTFSGQTTVNVVLTEESIGVDEVVVIGYGSQSREMVTTSITKVDSRALESVPYSNAAAALQGTVSGVRVQNISGQPGSAPRVIIRGGTSINNPDGASPLYIIDGVIRPQMVDISADDIESIQVLKDAAATSIYGARGSNGVVIITTKSGKAGQIKVTYGYDLTISNIGKLYEMASVEDYLTFARSGMIAASKFPDNTNMLTLANGFGTGNDLTNKTAFSTQYLTDSNKHKLNEGWQSMPDPVDPSKTIIFSNTDFQDLVYRTGISHNHHIEASGGTDKATFNAGLGYLDNEGAVITTGYKRLSFNLNGSLQAKENLNFNGRVVYSNSKTTSPALSDNITFLRIAGLPRTAKFKFEDGSLAPGQHQNMGNPLYQLTRRVYWNDYDNLTISLGADWEIIPGLTFNPQVSMYNVYSNTNSFQKAYWNGPLNYDQTREASASEYLWRQYQADAVFNYVKTFAKDHQVVATAGYSLFSRKTTSLNANGRGASSDLIPTLSASATPVRVYSYTSDQIILGYFGRINYSYQDKYILSANARYDAASNLGDNNKWGLFPGLSVGWHVDKEKFWAFVPKDMFRVKLRASYGVNGNISGLGDFAAAGAYGVGTQYFGGAAVTMSTMPNQDLQWEQSKTFDLGADINLFGNRVNLLFDYFHRITDQLITNLSLPPSTGFSSIQTNFGSLENRGIEFEVSAQVLPSESKVKWNVSFNASKVENKILKLPVNGIDRNRVGGYYIWDSKLGGYAWKGGLQEGGRMGDMFAYKQTGIYTTDAEAASAPVDNIVTVGDKTKFGGDVIWLDADKNNIIDSKDQTYMGNPYPKWTGGFASTIVYKGVELYVRCDYMTGHTIYNYAKGFLDYNWQGGNAMTQDVVERSWKKQGDNAEMPRHYYGGDRGQQNTIRGNSIFYEPGDFIALRELTLSYKIPSKVVQKLGLDAIRFSATGNNLYYFTKYRGLNPEYGGTDNGRYAMPRNIIFSANISF